MKNITFDINQIELNDLDGQKIEVNLGKALGNIIYMKATTLEWDAISRKIYEGKKVVLTPEEFNAMYRLLLSPDTPLYLYVKKPLKAYMDSLTK